MKRLRVHNTVMTYHDACTSGTSRVLSVAPLKMEAIIPAHVDYEWLFVIKFLNTQSMAPIEIHRQLCQVYVHTRNDGQHISCRSSLGRCLIIFHPMARTSRPVIFIFSYTSRNSCPISVSVFIMTERRRWVPQWFQSQAAEFFDTEYKNCSHRMKIPQFRRWTSWK